ncbi:MAG: hypothetical protein ACLQU3_03135 [Limisphaerales bacterium]
MNSSRTRGKLAGILGIAALFIAVAATTGIAETARSGASRNLVLWDTLSPVGERLKPDGRSGWKAVPNDLVLLEKDPLKASSDPGYYGREYSFEGDAVVETPTLTAVFGSAKGRVTIYSKQASSRKDEGSEPADWIGGQIVEVSPINAEDASATISHLEVLRNADDEIVLKVCFSPPGSPQVIGIFSFDRTGIVEIKPAEHMEHVRLSSSIEYGVVPSFIGDDLIFGASERPATNRLAVPSESLFLGLLQGESTELVVTWPKGKQRLSLRFGEENGKPMIQSMDLDNDARSLYLAALSAPGIWHKEALPPDYLEKDVRIGWKRPFPAKWKTQLYEEDLKTTFAFREFKGDIWRGVPGSYDYPAWFSGDDAFYHLSKKVPPKGESVIYCLEGRDTPLTVWTPADILKQTLGREAAEPILDFAGRKLRTHHRRGGMGVRRACTCGCTEAIQAVFEAGEEVSRKDDIQGALDDMIYFVHCHVERINQYRQLADALLKTLQEKRQSSPELKPFLDSLEEIARQIPQECEVQKENMKTFGYADDLSRKTIALTARKDPNNVKAYAELLKDWREMGGAQDYVLAKCHTITRNLCQAAGYGCGAVPDAVSLAEEIRARCRQALRNPDGYEIWADY